MNYRAGGRKLQQTCKRAKTFFFHLVRLPDRRLTLKSYYRLSDGGKHETCSPYVLNVIQEVQGSSHISPQLYPGTYHEFELDDQGRPPRIKIE